MHLDEFNFKLEFVLKMPSCFVPNCEHTDRNSTCKWLRFPCKEVHKKSWIKQIGRFRLTAKPTGNSVVCSCHFVDGMKEYGPTIFSWTKDKSEKLTEAAVVDDSSKSRWNLRARRPQNYALKDMIESDEEVIPIEKLSNKRPVSCESTNSPSSSNLTKRPKLDGENTQSSNQSSTGNDVADIENDITFKHLLDDVLMSSKWGIQKLSNEIIISQIEFVNGLLQLRKCIVIEKNVASIYFDRNKLSTETFNSRTELTNLLCRVDNQKVCPGGPLFNIYDSPIWNPSVAFADTDYSRWRHNKCTHLYDGQEQSCAFCLKLFDSLLKRQRRLKISQQQKLNMQNIIREKFECIKEQSCSLPEIKQEQCADEVNEVDTGTEVDLTQMKNTIRNKFLCIKEKGGLVQQPIEAKDTNVDVVQMKNIIRNKFNCIKDQSIIENTPESGVKSVNLLQMKNMIKNKFASITEKGHLLQETNDLGLKLGIKEEKCDD